MPIVCVSYEFEHQPVFIMSLELSGTRSPSKKSGATTGALFPPGEWDIADAKAAVLEDWEREEGDNVSMSKEDFIAAHSVNGHTDSAPSDARVLPVRSSDDSRAVRAQPMAAARSEQQSRHLGGVLLLDERG